LTDFVAGILLDYLIETISLSLPSSINGPSYLVMSSSVMAVLCYRWDWCNSYSNAYSLFIFM